MKQNTDYLKKEEKNGRKESHMHTRTNDLSKYVTFIMITRMKISLKINQIVKACFFLRKR